MTEAVGTMVRDWRQRRRLSQQALSERTGVSTRHLSYIETGRSTPSRDMVGKLGEALQIPLRAQRNLYTAAGFAPTASQLDLQAPALRHVNSAIEAILTGHQPYPALMIDGGWDLVAANDAAYALLADLPPELLEPPVNVVRLTLQPGGLRERIANFAGWSHAITHRIRHEYEATADERLGALLAEITRLVPEAAQRRAAAPDIVLTLRLRAGDEVLSFFTTTTVFGTPYDVTVADLAIEALYPADDLTRRLLTAPPA
jgi:transcriptional regulator with XRE-family HTH domain